jgi:hypothetical protein
MTDKFDNTINFGGRPDPAPDTINVRFRITHVVCDTCGEAIATPSVRAAESIMVTHQGHDLSFDVVFEQGPQEAIGRTARLKFASGGLVMSSVPDAVRREAEEAQRKLDVRRRLEKFDEITAEHMPKIAAAYRESQPNMECAKHGLDEMVLEILDSGQEWKCGATNCDSVLVPRAGGDAK